MEMIPPMERNKPTLSKTLVVSMIAVFAIQLLTIGAQFVRKLTGRPDAVLVAGNGGDTIGG
jgi:hypothetical protein